MCMHAVTRHSYIQGDNIWHCLHCEALAIHLKIVFDSDVTLAICCLQLVILKCLHAHGGHRQALARQSEHVILNQRLME